MINVDIYILDTDTFQGKESRILPLIAPCYAEKYERMKVHSGKMQELGAGYLLYKVLGISKDEQLVLGEYGKPGLNREHSADSGSDLDQSMEFSLSHADNYAVLATSSKPLGVDIERCDRLTLPVLERVLPPAVYEKIASVTDIQEWAKAWTSTEAALKADGRGFSADPREDDGIMNKWNIESFLYKNKFMVSCACSEQFTLNCIEEACSLL